MKILLFYHALEMGGVGSVVAKQVNWWAEHGYDITLALFAHENTPSHHLLHPGVKVIYLDIFSSKGRHLSRLVDIVKRHWRLRQAAIKNAPDIIISHVDIVNIRVLLSTIGIPTPVIAAEHTDPTIYNLDFPWTILRRYLYKLAARLIVLNKVMQTYYTDFLPHNKVEIFPNPIPIPKHTVGNREKTILYLGRLSKEKGIPLLIEAFSMCRRDGWRILIAGDGPDRLELEELVEHLDLKNEIRFLGSIRKIEPLLNSAGIFVLPSYYEGFPVALCEAMVAGAPCIATQTEGAKTIITHDIDGKLIPIGDVFAMRDALTELMNDKGLRATLGNNAKRLRTRVGIDAVMNRWNNLLNELAKN